MSFLKTLFLLSLLLVTWAIRVYHISVFPKPAVAEKDFSLNSKLWEQGQWINKSKFGINQLVLQGSPYERGLISGHFTQSLMAQEEAELIQQFEKIIPQPAVRVAFNLFLIRWFWGLDKFFESWMIEEMYGVSRFSSSEFDYLATPLTRQVSYHGLHEVGQMMVDQKGDTFGCTVVALPTKNSWIIGRNFDFEGGHIFDEEKIMKWVFPDKGYPFVSIIWAGMVGAITGVNAQGVYISMNAAGTTDFKRYGTPSSLVLLRVLQFARNADDAIEILKSSQMFITDIFVVSDRFTGKTFRVEKSPKSTEVFEITGATLVTNHLMAPHWKNDKINVFRRDELTSSLRLTRGEALLKLLPPNATPRELELQALGVLRDKGEENGIPLHLGNRRAIDALIATHSVIYNAADNIFFVSKGPSLSGEFIGFDLTASFRDKTPSVIRNLPRDPLVSDEVYHNIKKALIEHKIAAKLILEQKCSEAEKVLEKAKLLDGKSYSYYTLYGDALRCGGNWIEARVAWKKALALSPAYPREVRELEDRLK